jgi:AraC-like DNA-binding protein/mannose-6-phosphate isomerase-like protein (cupin superfamily)
MRSPATASTKQKDSLPTIIPIARDEALGFDGRSHRHAMGQLIYAVSGVVSVTTEAGTWVMPPNRAVWVPAGVEHSTRSHGPVKFRALFVPAGADVGLPDQSSVTDVSPLLRQLILRAAESLVTPRSEIYAGRLCWLLLQELRTVPVLPLHLPAPQHPALAGLCARLRSEPALDFGLEAAAVQVGMSRRTFMRLFLAETGMTFGRWRQQARVLASLPMLASGKSILNVALDCGYQSPSAFSTMFRRLLAKSPREYFRQMENT